MSINTYESQYVKGYQERVDYTPSGTLTCGTVVVQGYLVGVALIDVAAGALGELAVSGIFDFAKATATGSAITAGAIVYWDDSSNVVTTTSSSNKIIGMCVTAAADSAAVCRCWLKNQ